MHSETFDVALCVQREIAAKHTMVSRSRRAHCHYDTLARVLTFGSVRVAA
jgi:hypothetical protein